MQKISGDAPRRPPGKPRCQLPERTAKPAISPPRTLLCFSPNRETKARDQPAANTTKPEKVRNGVRLENPVAPLPSPPPAVTTCVFVLNFCVSWSWRRDSNPRPSDYKSDALPTELRQRVWGQRAPPRKLIPRIPPRCPGQLYKLAQSGLGLQTQRRARVTKDNRREPVMMTQSQSSRRGRPPSHHAIVPCPGRDRAHRPLHISQRSSGADQKQAPVFGAVVVVLWTRICSYGPIQLV